MAGQMKRQQLREQGDLVLADDGVKYLGHLRPHVRL